MTLLIREEINLISDFLDCEMIENNTSLSPIEYKQTLTRLKEYMSLLII